MTTTRSAADDAFNGQAASLEQAVFADGFNAVLTAGGRITAHRREQRGNDILVNTDQEYAYLNAYGFHLVWQ